MPSPSSQPADPGAATADVAAEAARGASQHILIPVTRPSADIELPPVDARTAVVVLAVKGSGKHPPKRQVVGPAQSLVDAPQPGGQARVAHARVGVIPVSYARGLARRTVEPGSRRGPGIRHRLVGRGYDTVRETLADLNRASDPFITRVGPAWMFVFARMRDPAARSDPRG